MKFQEWLLQKSAHKSALWIVFVLTVFDSIFLFIPPEVFMAPPIVADKKRAFPVFLATSLGSLVGGAISYMIGVWLFDSVGIWIINNFASMDQFANAQTLFAKYGFLIILMSAFSPVPYKLLAIVAGFVGFNPFLFLGLSNIFRSGRFAVVAYLLWRFQERANSIVSKYFWPLTIGAIIAAFLGLGILYLL